MSRSNFPHLLLAFFFALSKPMILFVVTYKCIITFAVHLVWRSWLPADRRCLIMFGRALQANLLSLLHWTILKQLHQVHRNNFSSSLNIGHFLYLTFLWCGGLVYIHNAILFYTLRIIRSKIVLLLFFYRNYAQPICSKFYVTLHFTLLFCNYHEMCARGMHQGILLYCCVWFHFDLIQFSMDACRFIRFEFIFYIFIIHWYAILHTLKYLQSKMRWLQHQARTIYSMLDVSSIRACFHMKMLCRRFVHRNMKSNHGHRLEHRQIEWKFFFVEWTLKWKRIHWRDLCENNKNARYEIITPS